MKRLPESKARTLTEQLPPLSDHPVILDTLAEKSIPTVRVAPRLEPSKSPSVGIDDYAAARRMTRHLLDLGHVRIGFILGRPGHGATDERYRGAGIINSPEYRSLVQQIRDSSAAMRAWPLATSIK